jgi:hypothetical protein
MLPFDNKPWAKTLAGVVVGVTVVALICLALYLHHLDQLRIPEYVGLFLLFLTIVPPNLAVIYKKPKADAGFDSHRNGATAH